MDMISTVATEALTEPISIPSILVSSATSPQARPAETSIELERVSNALENALQTTSVKKETPRLLYRGSLSVPDSHMLLDGLTFTINLPSDDPQATMKLLESPLPLALESMRGRTSLSFVGVQKLEYLYCDYTGGVKLHVHPRSILTHQLFSHCLCTNIINSSSGRTDLGIRIRLGESETAEPISSSTTNDIIVYGRPHPSSSVMQLCVALILPPPSPVPLPKAVTRLRPPRPDDPIPRLPPLGFGLASRRLKRNLSEKGKGKEKQDDSEPRKRAKPGEIETAPRRTSTKSQLMQADIQELGKNSRVGKNDAAVFKIPALPASHEVKGKMTTQNADDVFSVPANEQSDRSNNELKNKTLIKKSTVKLLTAVEVTKQHPDFKEFFNLIYRGVCFAMRKKLKSDTIENDIDLIDSLITIHIQMYLTGDGSQRLEEPG